MYSAVTYFLYIASLSIDLNHGCSRISSTSFFDPKRSVGSKTKGIDLQKQITNLQELKNNIRENAPIIFTPSKNLGFKMDIGYTWIH